MSKFIYKGKEYHIPDKINEPKFSIFVDELISEHKALTKRTEVLEAENVLLAQLAADKPQFNNPLYVYEARAIRDRILEGN